MCGLPVIASNYSGHTDFLNHDNSFLVEPEGVRTQPSTEWISLYYEGMPMGDFGRESIDQTKAHMRYVYDNYATAKDMNKKLQNYIRENYDWGSCVDRMHGRIKDVYSGMKHRHER